MLRQSGSIHSVLGVGTPGHYRPCRMESLGPQCGNRRRAMLPPSFLSFGPREVVVSRLREDRAPLAFLFFKPRGGGEPWGSEVADPLSICLVAPGRW